MLENLGKGNHPPTSPITNMTTECGDGERLDGEGKEYELEAQPQLGQHQGRQSAKLFSIKDDESLLQALCTWIVQHQIGTPISL